MNDINLTPEQIVQASMVGVSFLNLNSTLIPGNMKAQIAVLEAVLTGVSQGQLQVVSPPPDGVKSLSEPIKDGAPDGKAHSQEQPQIGQGPGSKERRPETGD